MTLDEFFHALARANEDVPGLHTTHPGATAEALAAWEARHGVRLPTDLVELLRRSNGVGLHQDWVDGREIYDGGAFVLYPVEKIMPAAKAMYDADADEHPDVASWFAIGEGPDASVFFAFAGRSGHFLEVAPILPQEPKDWGSSIAPLLVRLATGWPVQ